MGRYIELSTYRDVGFTAFN